MIKNNKILNDFMDKFKDSPEQGSKEWLALRPTSFGGSEVSVLIGINPFSTLKKAIGCKIGINPFRGNSATRWGNLFEQTTQDFTELVLRMNDGIKELGNVTGPIDGLRYSPDGLGVVKLLNNKGNPQWYIILFEFKSPSGMLPNGKIPKHYVPQIQTGMMNINVTDCSIFVSNCYRKCSLNNLQFDGLYDKKYHYGDWKKRKYGLEKEIPFACGIICFYQTADEYDKYRKHLGYESDSYDDNATDGIDIDPLEMFDNIESITEDLYYKDADVSILLDSCDKLIDIGASSTREFQRVLELFMEKRIIPIYQPMTINKEKTNEMDFISTHKLEIRDDDISPLQKAKTQIEDFEIMCEEKNLYPIGYLPWKLMRSDVILEEKDMGWHDKIHQQTTDALSILKKIHASKDPISTYNTIFNVEPDVDKEEISCMMDFMSV